ncbi:MAG: hypothetical protein MUF54_15400 [Polyangiaceae bacterium]|nr:hypothetical protein [Polyangiaceae bacterium]
MKHTVEPLGDPQIPAVPGMNCEVSPLYAAYCAPALVADRGHSYYLVRHAAAIAPSAVLFVLVSAAAPNGVALPGFSALHEILWNYYPYFVAALLWIGFMVWRPGLPVAAPRQQGPSPTFAITARART